MIEIDKTRNIAFKNTLKEIKKAAKFDINIMLIGETGSGKGEIAGFIHRNSDRKLHSVRSINCASIATGLFESEFFGHVQGAFTGATKAKDGIFQLSNGSTLFLDEIGEILPDMQAKLLHVIEKKEFKKVGGATVFHSDFRLISATNQDIFDTKVFRQDLLYRLNEITFNIPALRDRLEDLDLIVPVLVGQNMVKLEKNIKIEQNIFDHLKSYSWPGNVRELKNFILKGCLLCNGSLTKNNLDFNNYQYSRTAVKGYDGKVFLNLDTSRLNLEETEKNTIIKALIFTKNNKRESAELLGITERVLTYKTKKYNIEDSETEKWIENTNN